MFQRVLVTLHLIKGHIAEGVISQGELHNVETDRAPPVLVVST